MKKKCCFFSHGHTYKDHKWILFCTNSKSLKKKHIETRENPIHEEGELGQALYCSGLNHS